ncbi:Caveolin-1 [Bulinus truncatus]|nr:Caveolin-1 [Bulinus truncatus]
MVNGHWSYRNYSGKDLEEVEAIVTFEEIFAEPHSTVHSFDSVWLLSFKVFNQTKLWCYRITSLIFGIPLAFLWGLHFGCLACCTIWCCRPGIKACQIELGCVQSFVQIFLDCLYKPLFVAVGYVFTNIRVKITKQAA